MRSREGNVQIHSFRLLVTTLVGIIALNAAGVARAERLSVRLDFIPVGFHAAMHLANQKGWFAREGLELEIQDGTGSLNTIQLVGSGQIDVGQVQLGVMHWRTRNGDDR